MNENTVSTSAGGLSFVGVLQLIFITLKLCGVINWSWALVLIPLWINLGLLFIIAMFFLVIWLWHSGD